MKQKEFDEIMSQPLMDVLKELGWIIAIPSGGGPEDDKTVHGFIIGEQTYVDFILKHLE